MLTRGMRKTQIEDALYGKGDFIQIDHLLNFIKQRPPIDMKKFAYIKLAKIYLSKEMFSDAAKMFKNAAINSIQFKEKQENYLRETKCYIRGGIFDEVQNGLRKAFSEANSKERREIYDKVIVFYKKEGERLIEMGKQGKAMSLYEKLIRMKMLPEDKLEVKEKLLAIYEKLGKRKEHSFLKSIHY